MKKVMSLIIGAIIFACSVYAQEKAPGSKTGNQSFFGGNLSFNFTQLKYDSDSKDKIVSLNVMPVIGLQVGENIVLGVALGFSMVEGDTYQDYWEEYSTDSKSLGLSVFLRTYTSLSERFKLYYEPVFGRTFYLEDETDKDIRDYFLGLNFGMLYFVKPHFSVEIKIASAMYENISVKDSDFKTNIFDVNYDIIQPNFGLKYYFD